MTATDLTEEPADLESPIENRGRSGHVRPMCEDDLAQVTELYQRLFGDCARSSPAFLKRIFFEPPWPDESLTSLTYEDSNGQIIGCLGVMPRRMKFRGNPIRAAVGHHFMVDTSRRGTRAAVELARRFLRGPQDFSLAEGNESSRRIWEFLGGSVSLLYSFCWTRPLRPAQYALTVLNQRGFPAAAGRPLIPFCQAVDATFQLVPQHTFRIQTPTVLEDDLDPVTMLAFISTFSSGRSLQPVYDFASISWIFEVLEEKRHRGALHKVAVRTESGRPLGWYLYYLAPTGIAEVVQIGGSLDRMPEVLNHLFYHAWRRGAVAATGLIDSHLCGVLSQNHCVLHRPDKSWTLVHSFDPQLINAVNAGDAFLTRLESEWWIAS